MKPIKIRRRQIILASLLVAFGTAIYLNWQFSPNKNFTISQTETASSNLGETRYVNSSGLENSSETEFGKDFKSREKGSDFFSEARINRKKSREESLEMMKKILSDSDINNKTKVLVSKEISALTKSIQQETNIENLTKSKCEFSDCLAVVNNNCCILTVAAENLSKKEIVQLSDIVHNQTGFENDKISIVAKK
jgi:stage III sporulation protein AH